MTKSLTMRVAVAGGLVACVAVLAIRRAQDPEALSKASSDPEWLVEFAIVEAPSPRPGVRQWEATHAGRTGTARFDIRMEVRAPAPDEEYAFTRGELRARPGSNAGDLLSALARAHHVDRGIRPAGRVEAVGFETAILGLEVSRGRGSDILAGAFTSQPKGPWILAKIFLEPNDAEIFIGLNPSGRVGVFLAKDDEYWPDLEPVLASVL